MTSLIELHARCVIFSYVILVVGVDPGFVDSTKLKWSSNMSRGAVAKLSLSLGLLQEVWC